MLLTSKKERQEAFLNVFEDSNCQVYTASKKIGVTPSTVYYWMREDSEFAEKVVDIREKLLDFAEVQLMKNIKEGKETSLIFFLKCQGKHRGYVEKAKVEYEKDGDKNIKSIEIIVDNGEEDQE